MILDDKMGAVKYLRKTPKLGTSWVFFISIYAIGISTCFGVYSVFSGHIHAIKWYIRCVYK